VSEKRASTASGSYAKTEPKGGDALARLSDHLGRLLTHADELLAEWQAHAEGVRARLDVQAREAGAVFQEAVGDALAEAGAVSARELERAFGQSATRLRADLERAQKAAADLDAHMQRLAGGAGPSSVDELRAALAGISSKLDALTRARHGGKGGVPWAVILAGSANVLVVVTIGLVWSRSPDRLAPIPLPPLAAAIASVPDAPPAAAAPSPAAAAPRPCADLAGETTAKVVAE
jgi:hypothetical protein